MLAAAIYVNMALTDKMDFQPPEFDTPETATEEKFWTKRRIVYAVLIIITLVAFLTYVLLSGWFYTARAPAPRPVLTQQYQRG